VTDQHLTVDGGNQPVTLRILDRDYLIRCPAEEHLLLETAARRLNEALLDARDEGNIIDSERLTVMVALNLVCDLVELEQLRDTVQTRVGDQVKRIGRRLGASQTCSPRPKGTP
jgi:cell division protein ZapA